MSSAETTPAPVVKKKPTRPNKDTFQSKLNELEAELRAKEQTLEKARNAVKNVKVGSVKNEAREKLLKELTELKARQNELKIERGKVHDQIKTIEAQIGKKITELQASRGKSNFKSVDEIEKRIKQLEQQVESGTMRLVDEKRSLSEVSNLKKLKASFSGFAASQESIDADKDKVAELKKTAHDAEYKKIGARIGEIGKELDKLKEADQAAFKSRTHLFDARTSATKARDEVRDSIRKLKDEFYGGLRAFNEHIKAEQAARIEREKSEKKAAERSKKLEEAENKLEAAKAPAFAVHVETAKNLLAYFDPEYKKDTAVTSLLSSNDSLNTRRTARSVDLPEGAKVMAKKDEGLVVGNPKKNKNKKSKDDGKLKLNLSIIDDLSLLNVPIPTSKEDVPNTISKIKEKIVFYEENEERVTSEKVERATADLEKIKKILDKEDAESAKAEAAEAEAAEKTESNPVAVEASA